MLILLICAAIVAMRLWPQTPAGRFLRRWLVEMPARKLRPSAVLFAFAVLIAIVIALAVAGSDGLVVAAQGTEAISWFVTFDVATYVDVIAIAWLLARTVRLRAVLRSAATGLAQAKRFFAVRRLGPRSRATRRPRHAGGRAPPRAEDGPGWTGLAYA